MADGESVTVLAHTTALLDQMDRRYQQRFDDATTAIHAAMVAAEKAVTKAEVAGDKRFELLNELRVGVATKEEVEALEKRLNELVGRLDRIEGRSGGLTAGWAYLVGAIGVVTAVAAIIVGL